MNNDDAKALLEQIKEGNLKSFDVFYRGHSNCVFAYARAKLRNDADAEDVLIDTMHEVWKSAARFRDESLVRTWVIGIARNKLLMTLRGKAKGGVMPILEDVDDISAAEEYALVRHEPDMVELITRTEQAVGTQKCLDRLTWKHRECLHLFYFEGYALAEIASIQEVDVNTVKQRMHQARLKIKECLLQLCRELGNPLGKPV